EASDYLFCIMIDCYSDRPLGRTAYRPGQPFLEACPFYDASGYFAVTAPADAASDVAFPDHEIYGGPRMRLFQALAEGPHPPTVSKIPLSRCSHGRTLFAGCHHG
ncbi:hypothetical protein ABTM06_19440, partial [Acinetobacter baumannii]